MITPRRLALPLRTGRIFVLAAAAAFLLFTIAAHAQSAADARSPVTGAAVANDGSGFANTTPPDVSRIEMFHHMALQRNELRQKEIVEETTRLLSLAQQLKAAVDKSTKDQLSLQVVDTASEIEKLAKNVKDKMRDGN